MILGRGRGGRGRRGVVVTDFMTGGGAIPHVLQQSRAYEELPQNRLLQSRNLSPYSQPENRREWHESITKHAYAIYCEF